MCWNDDPGRIVFLILYQSAYVLTHEGWVNAGRYNSLFGAPPPANPTRNTNPHEFLKSQNLHGLILLEKLTFFPGLRGDFKKAPPSKPPF